MAAHAPSGSASSDLFDADDPDFLVALGNAVLPGDLSQANTTHENDYPHTPPCGQPQLKRPRSPSPQPSHPIFPPLGKGDDQEEIDQATYGASRFGEYGEYMRRKRAKLQIQNSELDGSKETSEEKSRIFRGLEIYINGWTEPSVQDLRQLIVQHGGVFHAYLDKKSLVTHIITCSLTPAKVREFKYMKVVRPEWLVECVNAGSLLPWQKYIFRAGGRLEESQGGKTAQMTLLVSQADKNTGWSSESGGDSKWEGSIPGLDYRPNTRPPVAPLVRQPPLQNTSPFKPHSPSKSTSANITELNSHAPAPPVPDYAAHDSNPHAQRAMADPSWRSANTSAAPDFIQGFYKHSRLHHLSTWKAELKSLVAEALARAERGIADSNGEWIIDEDAITEQGTDGVSMKGVELVMRSPQGKGKSKAIDVEDRVIMHCDFDSFFVSAGLVDRPHLRGKPVVVCHSQGAQGGGTSTSEIASASYEAREFGIKNGMSLQQARKLCPLILTIPYEFEKYKHFSLLFYTILMGLADDLQAVSVDEALIDVTTTVVRLRAEAVSQGRVSVDCAKEFAEIIRAQVKKATGCEVSIGIAHNILMARLATRRAKPAGSYHLLPAEIPSFIEALDIKDLHGFGWSTHQKAEEKLGATKLGEIAMKSKGILCDALGKGTGETLYNAIRGVDHKRLESDKPRKSVSAEISYGIRFDNNEQAEKFVHQLCAEVATRLNDVNMRGRSMTLKVMKRDPTAPVEAAKFLGHGRCETFNKHVPLPRATCDDKVIGECAWRLLKSFDFNPTELRGIGIQIQKLEGKDGTAGETDVGQGKLPFKRADISAKNMAGDSPTIVVHPPSSSQEVTEVVDTEPLAGPSGLPTTSAIELPAFSQVDKDVLEALPLDVREELEAEYRLRSVSTAQPLISMHSPAKAPPKAKITVKGINVKRITKQLAPRNRPVMTSPKKNALFAKKDGPSTVNISDSELRKLDIDPEVFAVLPVDVQREQLVMNRSAKNAGGQANFIHARKVIKPFKRISRSPSIYRRRPFPKANHLQPPSLKQQGKQKGEKLYFTETADVQRVIESWVDGFKEFPPNSKDVEFFSKFLVNCVDREKSTDSGIEKAVGVVKWWLVLLRRSWAEWEFDEDAWEGEAKDMSKEEKVGIAWWKAFREVKEKIDLVARKKFGGCLSLK